MTKHYQWSIKTGRINKQSLYRLSDCYLRFYVKFIEPNRQKIEQDAFEDQSINQLPGFDVIMGIQIESLLLQNRSLLLKALSINSMDVMNDNPFVRRQTERQRGCQIDYLVQTYTRNLYVCEFKFKKRDIGPNIISEVEDKIKCFSPPRGFGVVPSLFHLGDVSASIFEKRYFYKVINIEEFLE